MPRILAVADEVEESLGREALARLRPDLVLSAGDLPFAYLEYLVTALNVPLFYVPGNHDPSLRERRDELAWPPSISLKDARDPVGPLGCTNVDGRIEDVGGIRVAGLGGSIRYREGPNQYTQKEMRRRAGRLRRRVAARGLHGRRGVDVLLTHAPPLGVGDEDDPAHRGFEALLELVERLSPKLLIHGHIHPYGEAKPDRPLGTTTVVNAVPFRLLEVEP
ncbi:MAG TPA: metallophosphoesterase [Actinomycetota bacterium]|nr:metallophosphoesterase [Actinomycetota bacterium]